jgi:hypothetical protein
MVALLATIAAPATHAQPATQPAATAAQIDGLIDSLRQSVRSLEAQVDSLKAENAALRRQLAEVQRVAAAAATSAPTHAAEPAEAQPSSTTPAPPGAAEPPTLQKGMSYRQAHELLGEPASVGERDGSGNREIIWKTHRGADGAVTRVIIAEVDAKGVVREFTEARDR